MEGGKVTDPPSAARAWVGDFKELEHHCGAGPDRFTPISSSTLYAHQTHAQTQIRIQDLIGNFLRWVRMSLARLRELGSDSAELREISIRYTVLHSLLDISQMTLTVYHKLLHT